ncbi:MAG TPA: hypothetical protein VER04_26055 [Polyangiaceae bacterium]|nr:hypothetical protein [Polyangiaceae bacterium]
MTAPVLTAELVEYMESGVSLLVGTRDAALRPASARGFGVEIDAAAYTATVFLPASGAALTLSNLRDNAQIALTFARGFDHRSLQVKGQLLSISETNERQRGLQDRYFAAFSEGLLFIGHRQKLLRRIRYYPSYALSFRIESMFDQTPGPGAGRTRSVAS